MNVDDEIITAGTPWYCPFTSVQKSTLVGTKIHGVKKACEIALKAHREEVAENDVLIFSLDTVLSAEMTKVNMHYLHLVFQREQLFMVSCYWMGLHDWQFHLPSLQHFSLFFIIAILVRAIGNVTRDADKVSTS